MDILPTETLPDLLNYFIRACAQSLPESGSAGKIVWKFIRTLRPLVTYDPLSGTPSFSIRSGHEESKVSIEELFSILESQSNRVIIAIDEFQQILSYPEKQTDAWLRSVIQKLNNVSFIFSGSQQHIMQDIFLNPAKPFFQSTRFMKIGKIDRQIYAAYIIKQFTDHKKVIKYTTVNDILNWADGYTWYVQLIFNRVFLASGKRIDDELWKQEASKLLKEQELVFFGYREILTKPQWGLLKAIARDGAVYQPTSAGFIARHGLGSPATVLTSLKSLQVKELIHFDREAEGKSFYRVYDLLFRRWIEK